MHPHLAEEETKKSIRRLKTCLLITGGIALGTTVGVILVLWMIWALIDGFNY